jgi:glycosyltransferase involved in cell wall biosynthesis
LKENQSNHYQALFCVVNEQDASVTSYLNILRQIPGLQIIVTKPFQKDFYWKLVNNSHFVICFRELRGPFMEVLRRAQRLKIRTAYATDDNLHEYAKVKTAYQDFNHPKVLETLKNSTMIFCSSHNLCAYYQHLTTGRTILLPANIPATELPLHENPVVDQLVLGFFGNPRGEIFAKIAPAFQKVALLRPQIKIFSAGVDLRPLGIVSSFIPFNIHYQTALAEVHKLAPNILIAPNSKYLEKNKPHLNLIYKSIAKLIDATRLGAILIASKIGPFATMGEEQGLITIDNTVEEWTAALLKAIDDERLRHNLFLKARNYLIENHESSKIAKEIARFFT